MRAPVKVSGKKVSTAKLRSKIPIADRDAFPVSVTVPDGPQYQKGTNNEPEYEAQQVARVELMMLKGVRSKRVLQELLDISDTRALDRYMRAVHARWELVGTANDFARNRGEGLHRLDLIDSELWSRLGNVDTKASPLVALAYLRAISAIQEQRGAMLGLTPKVIAAIGTGDDSINDFQRANAAHDKLAMLMRRLSDKIEDGMRVVSDDSET